MNILYKLRTFLISRIIGLIFLIISVILLLSLSTYSENDPTYGNIASLSEIQNSFGIYGAYISGFLIIFFSYVSYLFPIFFLIYGLKLTLGYIHINFVYRFFSFFVAIISLNLFLEFVSLNSGIVGLFLTDLLNQLLIINSYNFYLVWAAYLLFLLFAIILLLYGLSIKISFINNVTNKIIYLIKIILFPLRALKFSLPPVPKTQNKEKILKINKNKTKKEPMIDKNSSVASKVQVSEKNFGNEYNLPPITLLKTSNEKKLNTEDSEKKNLEYSKKLEVILKEYGVDGKINSFKTGPVITLFEFIPAAGIKTSKVVGLSEDIARAMASLSTRISFQPGKNSIGIEIPNNIRQNVYLGDLLNDTEFNDESKSLLLALGKNISGEKKYADLEKMPHLLIAGTTGSGKSVGINSMILSLLFRFKPSECKLILIDPKMLELSIYEDIPHLLSPVVTDPKKAVHALKWVVREMENRYRLMSSTNVKSIQSFNSKVQSAKSQGRKLYREVQTGIDNDTRIPIIEKKEIPLENMPFIVVIIDEMADLMMIAGKEVENLVQRLAQMARASGIHLITATQRPSVDVITGTIKANFPSRISFRVASRFDSRTILNEMGAEQLLGSGDMLLLENGSNLIRLHGGFVSENEIEGVVDYIKSQSTNEILTDITSEILNKKNGELDFNMNAKNNDELYDQAVSIVVSQQKVSTSFIQRYLQIGYNRAARIVEQMESDGIISEPNHSGKRVVIKK